MANHFQSLGLPVSDRGSFEKFMEFAAHAGAPQETASGYYICWTPGAGVEAWVQATLERQLCGCNPHFAGEGRVRAQIDKFIVGEHSALDGSAQGWLLEPGSTAKICPIVVDLPAMALDSPRISPPELVSLQIAAFARDVHCFANDAELRASQSPYAALASPGFVAAPQGAGAAAPPSEAILCGRIKRFEVRKNPLTQLPLHHFSVESFAGDFDVVASPEITRGAPQDGGLIAGSFDLTARIHHAG